MGGPKFHVFPVPAKFVLFFPLWGSSRGILVVFEAPGRSNVHEFSGCRVRAPAARSGGAAGVSHDSPRAQTCTFEVPTDQNTTAKFWAVRWKGGPGNGGPGKGGTMTKPKP